MNKENEPNSLAALKAISQITAELAKEGISKNQENREQGYRFRGIDDAYNAVGPLLPKHGLVIIPRMLSRACEERKNQKGNAVFSVVVDAEFDFTSVIDGSFKTVKMFGEARDGSDKATNKAMSAAYKYAVFQTFCIPTEGDNDADATTHEVVATGSKKEPPASPPSQLPSKQVKTIKEKFLGDEQIWTTVLKDVQQFKGFSLNGKPFTKYGFVFSNGLTAGSFSQTLAESSDPGNTFMATVKPAKREGYWDLISLQKVDTGEDWSKDESYTPSGESVEDEA